MSAETRPPGYDAVAHDALYVAAVIAVRVEPVLAALTAGDFDVAMAALNTFIPMAGPDAAGLTQPAFPVAGVPARVVTAVTRGTAALRVGLEDAVFALPGCVLIGSNRVARS